MGLSITTEKNICQIKIVDDLTIFEVCQYHQTLLDECSFSVPIKLDFSQLEEIDTAGIQLILSLEKEALKKGGKLFLQKTNPNLDNVLETFNLTDYFKPFDEDR